MLSAPLVNTCLSHVTGDLPLHMVFVTNWFKRRHMFQKYDIGSIIMRAAVFDVIGHCPSDSIGHRQG